MTASHNSSYEGRSESPQYALDMIEIEDFELFFLRLRATSARWPLSHYTSVLLGVHFTSSSNTRINRKWLLTWPRNKAYTHCQMSY